MIRRDRDRSRDFLADVSHELRTPIAALLTFNELLTERAGDDPAARAEFLNNSRVQLERLDWLAQNLLELSKLDSGLVLLDLRPDDLRAAVESAVEQAGPAARRRGIAPPPRRCPPRRSGSATTRSGSARSSRTSSATRSSSPSPAARSTSGSSRRRRRGADRGRRHGRRDRAGRAAADLRAVLPRVAGERGARQRQRARARDRPARSSTCTAARSRSSSRARARDDVHRDAAGRSAPRGAGVRRRRRIRQTAPIADAGESRATMVDSSPSGRAQPEPRDLRLGRIPRIRRSRAARRPPRLPQRESTLR